MRGRWNVADASTGMALLALLLTGCGPDEVERDYGAPTAEQEVALGLQAAPELADRYGGLSEAQELQAIVDTAGDTLARVAADPGLPFGVDFHLLGDSITADLFSLPGGQVFITRGLLMKIGNDLGQLAAVLAHEMAHVATRHAVRQLGDIRIGSLNGTAVLARYAPEDQRSRTSDEVQELIRALIDIRHTEAEEIEADERAAEYMRRLRAVIAPAGPPPGAPPGGPLIPGPASLIAALDNLLGSEQSNGRPLAFLTTHPITRSRMSRLQEAVQRMQDTPDPAASR